MSHLTETISTPIDDVGDCLVVGAGSAGIGAALAAARHGLSVTLIDPASTPGGTLISGIPILGYHDGVRCTVGGIALELVDVLRTSGGTVDDARTSNVINIDPERLKLVILDLLEKAGVRLRCHTLVAGVRAEGGRITHVITEGKGGRRALTARWVVDATGDADVAAGAGVPVVTGRAGDGMTQPMTLMFGIGGIDKDAFKAWTGSTWDSYLKLEQTWRDLQREQQVRNPRTSGFAQFWGSPNRTGEWSFNATRVLKADGTDSISLTRAEAEGRRQVFELLDVLLRPRIPGFTQAFIAWTAPKIGVRETRRIVGRYTLTRQDIWDFVQFPDAINHGSYPIDIHSPTGDGTILPEDHFYHGRYWSVPWRCLVPQVVDNLVVAGRCLSAEHEALAAVRVMANTIAMGEAAGTGLALCHQTGSTPATLDTQALRRALRTAGNWLP